MHILIGPSLFIGNKIDECQILTYMTFDLMLHLEVLTSHETVYLHICKSLFLCLPLHRELFRSSWMTSFRPSLASLQTAPLWLSNTFLTS